MKEQDTATLTGRRDPVVEKVHDIRQEHARKFNYDPEAIFEDLKRLQHEGRYEVVSFPARPVEVKREG